MRDYYDDEPAFGRTMGKVAFAAAVVVIGYFGYNQFVASGTVTTPTAAAASDPTPSTVTPTTPATAQTAPATAPVTAPAASTTDPQLASDPPAPPSTAVEPGADVPPQQASTTTTPTAEAAGTAEARPATLPDGSAAPVVAIFDTDTITLAGAVRSQASAERLTALAVANSKTPAAVIDLLTIDPTVPEGVGIRVVELNSSRFPAGSAEVLPAHATELDRMAAVMNALPNVTVLVIGHADQVGSEDANFAISEQRAQAVVHYLVGQGIDASRLSSRAVGESDLLSVDDDETSLALNRRTEFIVYGALVGA
jgi:outer membrane protein OmpA-like peptidoglycan-associated protein